jgi:hypothetical protein
LRLREDFPSALLVRLTPIRELADNFTDVLVPIIAFGWADYTYLPQVRQEFSGGIQGKNSNLRRTIDSYGQVHHPHAAICVLPHVPDPVQAAWILFAKPGENGGAHERQDDLSAMGMPGEL